MANRKWEMRADPRVIRRRYGPRSGGRRMILQKANSPRRTAPATRAAERKRNTDYFMQKSSWYLCQWVNDDVIARYAAFVIAGNSIRGINLLTQCFWCKDCSVPKKAVGRVGSRKIQRSRGRPPRERENDVCAPEPNARHTSNETTNRTIAAKTWKLTYQFIGYCYQ